MSAQAQQLADTIRLHARRNDRTPGWMLRMFNEYGWQSICTIAGVGAPNDSVIAEVERHFGATIGEAS